MVAVALKEAQATLAKLIQLASTGEDVTITEDGQAVARLIAEERPRRARKPVDLHVFEAVAAEAPFQTESAGAFFARVRAENLL